MAKAWVWVLVVVLIILGVIWVGNYHYSYYDPNGSCRDARGNYYPCEKTYRYSNSDSYDYYRYSYNDNYGNRVVISRQGYDFDNYYDCYHASIADDRYGQYLKENYGLVCNNMYSPLTEQNYISYQNNYERPPTIYVS